MCRNIDKAGGLDRYIRKIEGTKEDSEGAARIRLRLDRPKMMQRLQQEREEELRVKAEQKSQKAQLAKLHRAEKGKQAKVVVKQAQVEGKQNLRERQKAANEKEEKKDTTAIGWLKRNVLSGFKWS